MAMDRADHPIPEWINKWLLISAIIIIFDGSFCILRPHSLEGGYLETVFYAYRYYTCYDLHYGDATDSFVWAQGLGNIIEACLNLVVVFQLLKSVRLTKFLAISVSVMTFWKTVLFCLYSLDVGVGGHKFDLVGELMVNGMALVWLFFPAYSAWTLIKTFLETSPPKYVTTNYGCVYNLKTNSTSLNQPSTDKEDENDVTDSPSRYNLRKR